MRYRAVAAEEPPLAPTFAFVKTSLWERVDADARDAFAELVRHLGDRVEELELTTPFAEVLEWQRAVGGAEIAINLRREWEHGRDKLSRALRERIEQGREVRAVDYLRALGRIPELNASLTCTGNLAAPGPGPVLLVPGTGSNPPHNFGWNWEPALDKLGIPWCAVTLPDNALDDIQVAGEYVVNGIRTMYAAAGRRIAVMGHTLLESRFP